ncbi:MAG: S-layer homology domain-containing protein [Candidatus Saganbacteria bacterium]|nr:S-layer homology domain-containing protein [Candidatus Saganbacteria bacterium]
MKNDLNSLLNILFDFKHQNRKRSIRELVFLIIIICLIIVVLLTYQGKEEKSRTINISGSRFRFINLTNFSDVQQNYWGAKQIALVSALGIVTGYPDQTFRPKELVTRAQMAVFLIRGKGTTPESAVGIKPFKDVPQTFWAAESIYQAIAAGFLKGYPDGSFRPSQTISRAEGVAMICRFADIAPGAYDKIFPDVAPYYWYAPYLAGAVKAGVVKDGTGKPFNPSNKLTRAEAVEILFRTPVIQERVNEFLTQKFMEEGKKKGLSKEEAQKMLKKIDPAKLQKQLTQ